MGARIILLPCFFLIVCCVFGQDKGNEIIGTLLTEKQDGVVDIFVKDGKYFGKLIWLLNPNDNNGLPAIDTKNQNGSLRNRKLIGILILNSFEYDDHQKEWNNGKVYDPNMGHEANGIITLISKDVLKVKGYVGFRWISKSETWKRTSIGIKESL